ncbi:transporter [Antarcticibacterium flavum]|uniref:Transporter n=1 Tax=Antarcticibacterium flavum TaxID=2058175 RepID=A0A5B7WYV9_9FLAO|nr:MULTISPECIES: transporter [Antarcticibacterium]MCM4158999.1 transporter [Antarcticibacterium sp. W02-3]QCY68250.1 transporter [Antarcticibacterium flavum]
MRNRKIILSFFSFIVTGLLTVSAQYTETINSNRPGASQGAFSVGTGVLQFEAGGYLGNDYHNLRATDTDILGADYAIRYGLFFEALEISLIGSFQDETTTIQMGARDREFNQSNFRTNTLGVKYLIFDPSRSIRPDQPNLYSWRANQRFKWKTLIPAVAVYAGANFTFGDNPYLYEGENSISPKFILSTQNNWAGGWVFVTNLILDKVSEANPTYAGIFTLTHAFTPQFAGFLEYQGIISNIYADDLARTGVAYLVGDNLQFDISGLINFKNTPSRWQVAAGFSYRFDMHTKDETFEDEFEGDRNIGGGRPDTSQQ